MPQRAEKTRLQFTVNGDPVAIDVSPAASLLDVLRDELELTGTKRGCEEGECGACSVMLDGRVVNSCLILALECQGGEIVTIEGLRRNGELHPLQRAFIDCGAVQCGFCTPGMVVAAYALLQQNPSPSVEQIKRGLEGNLCRCTGYCKIIDAISSLAKGGR